LTIAQAQKDAGQRFSIKGSLLKAGSKYGPMVSFIFLYLTQVCYLAFGDIIGARAKINDFNNVERAFDQEREGRFLHDLLEAMEARDQDRFVNYLDIHPVLT
jgi:hypothetical protein